MSENVSFDEHNRRLRALEETYRLHPELLDEAPEREYHAVLAAYGTMEIDAALMFLGEILGVEVPRTHTSELARAVGDEDDGGDPGLLFRLLRDATADQVRAYLRV